MRELRHREREGPVEGHTVIFEPTFGSLLLSAWRCLQTHMLLFCSRLHVGLQWAVTKDRENRIEAMLEFNHTRR